MGDPSQVAGDSLWACLPPMTPLTGGHSCPLSNTAHFGGLKAAPAPGPHAARAASQGPNVQNRKSRDLPLITRQSPGHQQPGSLTRLPCYFNLPSPSLGCSPPPPPLAVDLTCEYGREGATPSPAIHAQGTPLHQVPLPPCLWIGPGSETFLDASRSREGWWALEGLCRNAGIFIYLIFTPNCK